VQIAAMNHGIGVPKAAAKVLAEVDVGDLLTAHRVHQPELVDIDGHGTGGVSDAEIIESVKGAGAELNTGADLAEFGRFLQYHGLNALARQADRGRQAADTAPGDQDGKVSRHRCVLRAIGKILSA
jgi:hypothetical protein